MKRDNNKSFFIIKPEAFNQREEIKRIITTQSDLRIIASKIVVLIAQDIDILYLDDVETDLMKAIKAQLTDAMVEVGIVAGKDAVIELCRICGEDPCPGDCRKGTVREKFGKHQPIFFHGVTYYLNAIHKASKKEVGPSLEWLAQKK